MKHEWKKMEKRIYLPPNQPQIVDIPKFNFLTIKGKGNPNSPNFGEYIAVLYSVSYAIKMSPKSGFTPENYFDYAVYPLEGIWDIDEEAKMNFTGIIDKNSLVFNLMIRQPEFVTKEMTLDFIELTKKKKPHNLLTHLEFESLEEGRCIQMMHIGSFDSEPESFKQMENYANSKNLKRKSLIHREIYLSDARKTEPERLRTILRFQVES